MNRGALTASTALALMLGACGGRSASPSRHQTEAPLPKIELSSTAFAPGTRIPARYTCSGADVSLPLHWSGVPKQASSLSLQMRDPNAPGGNFVHWSLTGIPASASGLATGHLPAGVVQGVNGFGTTGYRGPCPPRSDPPHHYVITLTALRGGRAVAVGTLVGTYGRG